MFEVTITIEHQQFKNNFVSSLQIREGEQKEKINDVETP